MESTKLGTASKVIVAVTLFVLFIFLGGLMTALGGSDASFAVVLLILFVIFSFSFIYWLYKRLMQRATSMQEYTKSPRYIPAHVKQHVYYRDGGRCVQCGAATDLEYDHIIPVSKGGSNGERNVQLLCAHCNRTKHAEDNVNNGIMRNA